MKGVEGKGGKWRNGVCWRGGMGWRGDIRN
jgi:hypothetical protein